MDAVPAAVEDDLYEEFPGPSCPVDEERMPGRGSKEDELLQISDDEELDLLDILPLATFSFLQISAFLGYL